MAQVDSSIYVHGYVAYTRRDGSSGVEDFLRKKNMWSVIIWCLLFLNTESIFLLLLRETYIIMYMWHHPAPRRAGKKKRNDDFAGKRVVLEC